VSPIDVGCLVLACVFGGAMLGMAIHTMPPEHHLNAESKDVIQLEMRLIATMSARVLAPLTNSAKGSYDTQRNEVTQAASNIIPVDRVLAHYGPETKEAPNLLKLSVACLIDRIWPDERSGSAGGIVGGRPRAGGRSQRARETSRREKTNFASKLTVLTE